MSDEEVSQPFEKKKKYKIKLATLVVASAAALANIILIVLIWQQNDIQKVAADRVWSSEQIAIIYDQEDCSRPDELPSQADATLDGEGLALSGESQGCQYKSSRRSRQEAVLAYAKIKESSKGEALLSQAYLSGMILSGANLAYVNFSWAYFENATLGETILDKSNLCRAKLKKAKLPKASLADASLLGADLREATLAEATLARARLGICSKREREEWERGGCIGEEEVDHGTLVAYSSADLREAQLQGADLTGAKLCDVDLSGADLTGATLTGADLSGANLSEADLTTAIGLSQEQVQGAKGNRETLLPAPIEHPKSWPKTSAPVR